MEAMIAQIDWTRDGDDEVAGDFRITGDATRGYFTVRHRDQVIGGGLNMRMAKAIARQRMFLMQTDAEALPA